MSDIFLNIFLCEGKKMQLVLISVIVAIFFQM